MEEDMKIGDYKGHEIHVPTSGGKAGKGKAKTAGLQIRRNGVVLKTFRFNPLLSDERRAALRKARLFIDERA